MFVLTWVVDLAVWHFGRSEERGETAAAVQIGEPG
jgi:hypothetical protein